MKPRIHVIAAVLTLASASVVQAQVAQDAPATRAAVIADFQKARASGQLHRTDLYDELASRAPAGSTQIRTDVKAQYRTAVVARQALPGPLRSRNYNPYGAEILKPTVAMRADVKNEVLAARADHTLQPAGEAIAPMGRANAMRTALTAY
jgi:hypothetical protein